MTPTEVLTYAQQQYNAVGDSFFAPTELYRHIVAAQQILAKEANVIENTYETSTVAQQQQYTFPTNTIAIKAVSYDDRGLTKMAFRDFKRAFMEAPIVSYGTPVAFSFFDQVLYLGPAPAAVADLDLYTFDKPGDIASSTGVLDVPEEYHLDIVNYLLWRMALKDQNFQAASEYEKQWVMAVERAKMWSRKRQTAGGFHVVKDEADAPPWWPR